ncbi:aldo-keto reductase family 1 member B1-like [Brachionichthys hirsutus]|uniref:aldo-keto reductase family 1 member B1-like n=1 Tax=Brachionichthys hirsutus TaxID=412623 RepID=UPI00360452E5
MVRSVTLSNGAEIPLVGLGTYKALEGTVTEAVKAAIGAGYRRIDGACAYDNEREVGAGIEAVIHQGAVKREEMFIVSKTSTARRRIEAVLNKPGLKYEPAANQIGSHPYLTQERLIDYCHSKGIAVTADRGERLVSSTGLGATLEEPRIKTIAEKYKKTPAQVLIRFHIQRNVIVTAKSANPQRIAQNFAVFELSEGDMETLRRVNGNMRTFPMSW